MSSHPNLTNDGMIGERLLPSSSSSSAPGTDTNAHPYTPRPVSSSTSTHVTARRLTSNAHGDGFEHLREDTSSTTTIQGQGQGQIEMDDDGDGSGGRRGSLSMSMSTNTGGGGEQQLEGSTLGSGFSRDEEKRIHSGSHHYQQHHQSHGQGQGQGQRPQRRTQSSSTRGSSGGGGGGFLLDTAFLTTPAASKLLRSGSLYNNNRRSPHSTSSDASGSTGTVSGTGSGKRRVSVGQQQEPEQLVVAKKKSRLPWRRSHQKPSVGSSPLGKAVTTASSATAEEIPPHQHAPPEPGMGTAPNTRARAASAASNGPTTGLDTDAAQIVTLALNLSESRRRSIGGPGRFASSPIPGGGRRLTSSGGPQHPSQGRRLSGYPGSEDGSRAFPHSAQQMGRESSTPSGLGFRAMDDGLRAPYEPSQATLARAEKARVHFELFYEYLRLLPHLPPLRSPAHDPAGGAASQASDGTALGRVYNPLQAIRNRKVRFREKCPIDTESEGWHDVARVHEWVNAIEEQHGEQKYDTDHCVILPPFQDRRKGDAPEDKPADGLAATSPASSLRRGTGTVKLRRPRIDWIISPAELLADAAWLEEGRNKTKIVDRDGNKLYPDSIELKRTGREKSTQVLDKVPAIEQQEVAGTDELASPTLPTFQHSAPRDSRSFGRGRRRHRLQNSLHISVSRSGSEKDMKSKFRRSVIGSSSSSSSSSSDDEGSRGRGRSRWSRRLNNKRDSAILDRRVSDLRDHESPSSPKFPADDAGKHMVSGPSQASQLPSPETRMDRSDLARGSVSSATSTGEKDYPRMSMESTAPNSPAYAGYFPSIAVNLSPPSSRSPSPGKKALPRMIGPFHERKRSRHRNKLETGGPNDESSPEPASLQRQNTDDIDPLTPVGEHEPSHMPDSLVSHTQDERAANDVRRASSPRARKSFGPRESRLSGIFKGGRIAEIVGNEVSRVGDFIWKKDSSLGQSRKTSSSAASSVVSDDSDDEKGAIDWKSGPKALLQRLPTLSDEGGRLLRRETEKDSSKSFIPHLPIFTSPFKQDEGNPRKSSEFQRAADLQFPTRDRGRAASAEHEKTSNAEDASMAMDDHGRSYGYDSSLDVFRDRNRLNKGQFKDASERFSLTRPPVTGLANVEHTSSRKQRPKLSEATRAWSISDRSITTLSADRNLTEKREIERVRALLLTSGIKAREICRRAETIRSVPADFLVKSLASNPSIPVPRVPQIEEFDCAARNLVQSFQSTKTSLQHSMTVFSTVTTPALKTKLESLEALINQSLTPRVRAAAADAEALSTQLNTTSTLAVKQLSDALDKGIRKRNRRFRWVRRVGFVLLEWVVVGVMWWVWLVVMVFKITRGVWRGAISGIRWVLWL
ncbi:hypothetical protein M432DRAFT_642564 [Thermoascus aurantiacus ATCC 26904]